VVDLFTVNNEPSVPYGVKETPVLVLRIDPRLHGINDKDTVFFDIIHHPALTRNEEQNQAT
jgi:hypothetical protein